MRAPPPPTVDDCGAVAVSPSLETLIRPVQIVVFAVIALGLVLPDPNAGRPVAVYFRGGCVNRWLAAMPPPQSHTVVLQPAYLLQPWNRLDALVLTVSWLT